MTGRLLVALCFALVAACGGTKKAPENTLVENDQAGESCCCRIETDDPEDPTFARSAVMECSSRHGTCIKSDDKCAGQPEPGTEDSSAPDTDDGALPPTVEETPTSF